MCYAYSDTHRINRLVYKRILSMWVSFDPRKSKNQGVPQMSLTDTFIRNVKPASSPRKYFDGEGLFLYVPPNGSKLWRMSYRFEGKTKLLSFGKYPTVRVCRQKIRIRLSCRHDL